MYTVMLAFASCWLYTNVKWVHAIYLVIFLGLNSTALGHQISHNASLCNTCVYFCCKIQMIHCGIHYNFGDSRPKGFIYNVHGPHSIWKCHLTSIENPIVGIRRSSDRLISTMGFSILEWCHLYIELGPMIFLVVSKAILHCSTKS